MRYIYILTFLACLACQSTLVKCKRTATPNPIMAALQNVLTGNRNMPGQTRNRRLPPKTHTPANGMSPFPYMRSEKCPCQLEQYPRVLPEMRGPEMMRMPEIARTPEMVKMPEFMMPEVVARCPEMRMPELIRIPEMRMPEVAGCQEMRIPELIRIPETRMPELIRIPEPRMPELMRIPETRMPELIRIPETRIPEVGRCPEMRIPEVGRCPEMRFPEVGRCPEMRMPEVYRYQEMVPPEMVRMPEMITQDVVRIPEMIMAERRMIEMPNQYVSNMPAVAPSVVPLPEVLTQAMAYQSVPEVLQMPNTPPRFEYPCPYASPKALVNPFLPAASPVSAWAPPTSNLLPPATPSQARSHFLRKIPIPPPTL